MARWPDIDAVKLEVWREYLEMAEGNITHAGELFGIHKVHAMRLTRMFSLNEYAAELRVRLGQKSRGRPRGGDL